MSDAIIDRLYATFKPYRIGSEFVGCDHCVNPDAVKKLASSPLRDLSLADLDNYALKAMTTWGNDRHFKHFLPRLLELGMESPSEFLSFELLLGKLVYAGWDQWPSPERSAITSYFEQLWQTTIQRRLGHESDETADTILCAFGNAGVEIMPFLQTWLDTSEVNAPLHLAAFVNLNAPTVRDKGRLWNSYWPDDCKQVSVVVTWLQSISVRDSLNEVKPKLTGVLQDALWEIESICQPNETT